MDAQSSVSAHSPIHLGLGLTALLRGQVGDGIDGIGHYTEALCHELSLRDEVCAQYFHHRNHLPGEYLGQGVTQIGHYPQQVVPAALLGRGFSEKELQAQGVRLYHAPDHIIPRFRHTPVVATVMDAIPLSHPEWTRQEFTAVKNYLWRRMVASADHLITISHYAKAEIVHHFKVPPERISVTYLGVQPNKQLISFGLDESVRQRHQLLKPYFLILGTLQPRKNIARTISAYLHLPLVIRENIDLVIAGKAGWPDQATQFALQKGQETGQVKYLGYVSDLEKQVLLQGAQALVFTSLSEGFGLPILEAFAANVPVICSNTTSMPEVAGEAAVLIDPLDMEAITHAMQTLTDNMQWRAQLIEMGMTRLPLFQWSTCAQQTIDVYRRLLP